MIIETIVSTIDKNERVNFSPFGIKKKKQTDFHFTLHSFKNSNKSGGNKMRSSKLYR